MERSTVNPWPWSVELGYSQGQLVRGQHRTLYCSGQGAMGEDGKPRHADDMGAQLALAVDNLEAVLEEAGMTLAHLVRLTVYTTDVDRLFEHYGVLAARLGAARVAPATTMLGVTPPGTSRADGGTRGDRGRLRRRPAGSDRRTAERGRDGGPPPPGDWSRRTEKGVAGAGADH